MTAAHPLIYQGVRGGRYNFYFCVVVDTNLCCQLRFMIPHSIRALSLSLSLNVGLREAYESCKQKLQCIQPFERSTPFTPNVQQYMLLFRDLWIAKCLLNEMHIQGGHKFTFESKLRTRIHPKQFTYIDTQKLIYKHWHNQSNIHIQRYTEVINKIDVNQVIYSYIH